MKLFLLPLLLLGGIANAAAPSTIEFNRDIRPLLNAHCFKCHGGVKEAGDLNLQFRESALKAGESGLAAIVPGKPDESEFMARLITEDRTERMPKKEAPLSGEQIGLLRRWIAEGANWQDHWAYEKPRANARSIERTIGKRLQIEGLDFSPEASPATLARRSALDLTGLPPAPEELEAFLRDPAPDAYERWIDRLLSSPAYGERWAAPWLDLARYADSKGYESDRFRDMWRYRDWVIDAFNHDKPYDQFLIEQLAGDLLEQPGEEELIATAFHRNTPQNDEGGTDDEEFRTYAVIDRLNTTFDALQGTSIGCVQCHGHPYDAFVHREYYELLAFFNNSADADRNDQFPTRNFRSRPDSAKAAALEAQSAATESRIASALKEETNRAAFAQWLGEMRAAAKTSPLGEVEVSSTAGEYRVAEDLRLVLHSPVPERTTITVKARPDAGRFNELVLEVLPDKTLPGEGPGTNAGSGNFILTRITASLVEGNVETPLEIAGARATFEQQGWGIAEALKSGPGSKNEGEGGWAIAGGTGRTQTATFQLARPISFPPAARLRVVLECENERWGRHLLGSFRLSTRLGSEKLDVLPKELRDLAGRDPARWKPEERTKIERHFFSGLGGEFAELYRKAAALREQLAALPVCELPIMQELGDKEARQTRIFLRGNWMDKGAEVRPATPQILNGWKEEYPRNRLGFARWLTNGENPLTARVHVNRLWEQLFGIGLVETLEDFGSQGDRPIYQDLLDDLAVRFQNEMRWSQKALLREIVLSRVYRQSSRSSKALLERDPANRLLARGPRFRLTSEQIRDQALAASGILNRKLFGPPVMPYQPPGTWLVPYEGRDWATSAGAESQRRALYTFIRRSATYPSFVTFDAPNREYCVVRRTRTNTPLQSLDLLNSPIFMEAATALARRMVSEGGPELEEQLARGFYLAALRSAGPEEIAVLKRLHSRVNGDLRLVANAILNLDEVLNKN